MHAPSPTRQKHVGDREFVAMMAAIMALNALAIDAMLPAFPAMSQALGVVGSNAIQYVVSAYMLGMGVGSLIHGPLSDRYGRRPILFLALAGYVIFALICGRTTNFDLFITMRFAHGLCGAGLGVIATAVVRDRYSGDAMAKRMSLIFLIFMIVPIIAPSIGQVVIWTAGWRAVYYLFAVAALSVLLWIYKRLPETLDPDNVTLLEAKTMATSWWEVITHRTSGAYMLAGGMTQGAMIGFLTSSQQVFDQTFDVGESFALCFAVIAIGIASANFTNARIVERFGARRVSHGATLMFITLSMIQYLASTWFPASLPLFLILLTLNMALVGFIGSNFSSIAMQPFGATAGAASSFQNFMRSVVSVAIGAAIGQSFENSAAPLIAGFFFCGVAALLLILWGERGKLFTRPGTTKHLPLP
jgi:MFS transporter, DHA1 family, multidrug resistance protein